MPRFLNSLLDTGNFMPHGHCYLWNPGLVRLHLLSDLTIGATYVAISLMLGYFVRKAKNDLPFSWIFVAFGVFILACGATHFMEIWTLWTPVYWLAGAVKFVTAAASIATAIVLPPLIPKSLMLIRSARLSELRKEDLERANESLQADSLKRKEAEEEIRRLNLVLEERVRARTADLAGANRRLAHLAAIVECSEEAIIGMNLNHCITSWNPAAERMYGYSTVEVLGRPISLLSPAEQAGETKGLIERLKRGERVDSLETARVRKSGDRITVRLTLSPIRSEAGEVEGASHIASDITGRKRADDMFRLVVEAAPNAMVCADGEGRIVLVNAQTEKLFGYPREELIGREVDILVPLRYRGKHPSNRAEFMREPRARAMGAGRDLCGLRKDGSEFPVEIGLNPILTQHGTWVLSAIVDITERKRADDMFRLVVEAAPNAMVVADREGKIVLVNAQTEKLFGYPREELIGREVDILVPLKYRGKHPSNRAEFMCEPRARAMGAGRDLRGLRKDGTEFPVEIGLNPVATDQGVWVLSAIVDITERKRAEDIFRLVVEAAPNAMVVADGQGKIVLVNTQTEKLFGYSREELMGREVDILVPLKYRGAHPSNRAEFMREPRARAMGAGRDLCGLRKDGSEFPVEIGLNPIRTEHGTWVLSAIVDITERKGAEDMFRLLVEAAPNAMVVADDEGKIVLVNTQTEKLFGYPREELIGQKVDILVPLRYRDPHPSNRAEFMREPRARAMGAGRDLCGLRKDGGEFPVEIGLNPIRTEHGTWVLSAIVDITERKRPEEVFRLAVDAAPGAMVMADACGNIVLVNSKAETMFGYLRQELIGQSVDMLAPPRYRVPHAMQRAEFMREPQTRGMMDRRELYGLRKDGVEFPVEIALNPVITDRGTWVLSGIQDITERKRAEMEISRLNRELEDRVIERTAELTTANAELEAFSYSVSHDLRAPLRQIAGFSKILTESYGPELNPEAQRYLKRVQDGAQHMGSLIDDLLNLARVGRQSVSRRPAALNGLIEAALEVLKPERAGREIDWQIDPLWTVECDKGLLKQVFVNILSNAIKYTRIRDHAVIQIGQTMENGERAVFVRDNGAGFDMRYAGKLFGVFQRFHKAQDFEGTGVGLATCQRIIHKHGGRIWAEAQLDKGATFFFTIPNGKVNDDNDPGHRYSSR